MKICGKKIPKGNILLFLSFMSISLCLLIIVSATRVEKINKMSQNTLYTGHQKDIFVNSSDNENQWEDVISKLMLKYNNYALYTPLKDSENVVRGVFVKGQVEIPPMLEGEYFEQNTSWTKESKIVIGKTYKKDVFDKNGKKYYKYKDKNYEVLGIMGTSEDSRLNQMILIDFRSAIQLNGINSQYVLDTSTEAEVDEIGMDIRDLFTSPAEVLISLGSGDNRSFVARFLSSHMILETMYVMILISFCLSTVLIVFIWLRFRKKLFNVWKLCGYERHVEWLEIAKRFYITAGVGFMVGLIIVLTIGRVMSDINVRGVDVIQALGITIGLGTVILILDMSWELRIDKSRMKYGK